jgi:NADH-quinone oxidoreductase subunit M
LCSAGAVLGVVLGALYMISLYRRVVFGKLNPDIHGLTDLSFREIFVFTPLLILVFLVGLYPNFILRDLEGTTNESLRILKARSLEMQSHIHDSGFSQVEDSMNLKQS